MRLALAFEYLWWCGQLGSSEPVAITEEAVNAAIGFVEGYAKPMARRVYGDAALPVSERRAATLARWLLAQRARQFNARTVRREAKLPGLREPAEMDSACEVLADAGWISPVDSSGQQHRHRKDWLVEPRVWELGA